ncbi:MAG: uroporphyrinogen decarboxylase family protein [Victivallales bacterium]
MNNNYKLTSKDNLLKTIFRDSPEWVPNGMEKTITIGAPVIERPSQAGLDAFKCSWDYEKGAEGGTYPVENLHPVSDISRWENEISIPDVSKMDWLSIKEKNENIDRSEFLVQGFVEMGLFERSYLLLGMENAMIAYIEHPNEMFSMIGAIADYKIELVRKFHEAAGIDVLWYGDDWGTQNNLFMSPETWRTIIKPHTKRIYDAAKKLGIIVNQHSCGKIESVFGDIIEMGADIWNPCQPCNDLAGLKRLFGKRISFCGGIDSQFVLDRKGVTTDEVRAEVRLRIDQMAGGGGYIASPSHGVPYDQELIDAMNDEISTYGRSFYL